MSQDRETAGSILARLVQARVANASDEEIHSLEDRLGEQAHRQLRGENTVVTVMIGDRTIAEPAD